jgi:hypothetical protein
VEVYISVGDIIINILFNIYFYFNLIVLFIKELISLFSRGVDSGRLDISFLDKVSVKYSFSPYIELLFIY